MRENWAPRSRDHRRFLSTCGGHDNESSGSTTQPSTQGGGNEQLCSAVGALQSSVTTVQGLDDSSSVAEVERALTDVVDTGKEVASATEAGPQADVSGLRSSIQDLEDALKAVPSSEGVQAGLSGRRGGRGLGGSGGELRLRQRWLRRRIS